MFETETWQVKNDIASRVNGIDLKFSASAWTEMDHLCVFMCLSQLPSWVYVDIADERT